MDVRHWTRRLGALAEETSVPGAVLGIWADGEATVVPFGLLSTRTGVTTTADSVFQIGSITKTFTATMVAQLVGEGRASYDATVADLLPGVPLCRDDIADRVTLEHLLTHASGIDGDMFDDTGRGDDCVEKYVALLADAGHDFEPGDASSYCNSGFVVLGRIIEVLDGRTWEASLRARMVEPLGLADTVTLSDEAILRRAAVGHKGPKDRGVPYEAWALPRSSGPAGGITATAGDLLSYARTHLDDASLSAMRQPRREMPPGSPFSAVGLAWRLAQWSGTEVMGHDGGTIGQCAALRVLPERGIAVCVLTNGDNGGALNDRLLAEVLLEVAGVEMPAPPVPDPEAAPAGLARHTGRYERKGVAFDVTVSADDRLTLLALPDFGLPGVEDRPETIELLPVDDGGDRFVGRSDPAERWWPVTFTSLPDERALLYSSGRVAPRVS